MAVPVFEIRNDAASFTAIWREHTGAEYHTITPPRQGERPVSLPIP